jgi:4-alpha-glucanotransferase
VTDLLTVRRSGVLLHPTALPGRGVGELGDAVHRFLEWAAGAAQTVWQILPLVPVDDGGSPYNGLSAMAGNPLLVDLDVLLTQGLLEPADLADAHFPGDRVDFERVIPWKERVLARAHAAYRAGRAPGLVPEYAAFRHRHAGWLDDYALFRALRDENSHARWVDWPAPVRDREPAALREAANRLESRVDAHAFAQFLFERQWEDVREHARRLGILILGDIPIFVSHDSADVWVNRELFDLDETGHPRVVAGVPPDYFSATGQRWGNPLYRWDRMRDTGYRWWIERFRRTLEQVDAARVDHFRGFESYWEIPAERETALHGSWRPGPGRDFFEVMSTEVGDLPLVAEDLGIITPGVEALRDDLGLPGMRVLQFAFEGGPDNPHLPENFPELVVGYTGTHDNDTSEGWWAGATEAEREEVRKRVSSTEAGSPALMEILFRSRAPLVVVPLQDVLGLGSEARFNTPGAGTGNWGWRVDPDRLDGAVQESLRERARSTGRDARNMGSHTTGAER